jgi:hypothetical protein
MNEEWSDEEALRQIEHGDPQDERTQAAITHLEVSLNGGDTQTCRTIGLQLLGIYGLLRGIDTP